jgi:hypothetical protein
VAIPYAKPNDCVDIISSLAEVQDASAELESALKQSLLDASRLFENELIAPEDFFAPAGEDYEERTFYGNGTQFLTLQPYVSIEYIRDEDGVDYDANEYILTTSNIYYPNGYRLKWRFRSCSSKGWNWFDKVTVSARWGFKCVPPDVTVAIKNMGCLMFLTNSMSRLGLNTDTISDDQATRLRNTYNRILATWRDRFHHSQLGIG